MYLTFCLQYTLWNILSGCSSQLIVATPISQENHIKWKVFWQLYFTVLLDVVISSNIQNKISKNYRWSLHFTSDIRVELFNPQVLLADMVINYSLPLLHKQFGKPLRFCKRSVQQQLNGVDYCTFAAAFATDLLIGFSPEKRNCDESKWRSHLLMCFEQGKLVPFLQSTETRKESKQSLTLIHVYYKCRATFCDSDTGKNPGLY